MTVYNFFLFKRSVYKCFWSNFVFGIFRYDGVKEIAAKAPKLTFNTGEKAEIRSLNVNQAISKEGVAPQELGKMKSEFLSMLDNHPVLAKLIHQYT